MRQMGIHFKQHMMTKKHFRKIGMTVAPAVFLLAVNLLTCAMMPSAGMAMPRCPLDSSQSANDMPAQYCEMVSDKGVGTLSVSLKQVAFEGKIKDLLPFLPDLSPVEKPSPVSLAVEGLPASFVSPDLSILYSVLRL